MLKVATFIEGGKALSFFFFGKALSKRWCLRINIRQLAVGGWQVKELSMVYN